MSNGLPGRPGALSKNQIEKLIGNVLEGVDKRNVGFSSFDPTLSDDCWNIPFAVKPRQKESYSMVLAEKRKLPPQNGEFTLKKNKIYIFKLRETVNFSKSKGLFGVATGKSSLGRLDLLIRLISDKSDCYDYVPPEQSGSPLYVEIIPITFNVKVRPGLPISQLRLFVGNPELSKVPVEELEKTYSEDLLLDINSCPPKKFSKRLTVNLQPDKTLISEPCAFRSKKNNEPIHLSDLEEELRKKEERNNYKPKLLAPEDYWEPLPPDGDSLTLDKERFYILRSCERLYLPKYIAIACEAVKEELGELRVHYAGFAHPNFGRNREDNKGTPLIFEVRSHNFRTRLRHGEALASLEFYRMSEGVDMGKKSKYDAQELQLSKYFGEWKDEKRKAQERIKK